MSLTTPYDILPYESYTHARSHPEPLRPFARMFGVEPNDHRSCWVLEPACGNGAKIIPMADGTISTEKDIDAVLAFCDKTLIKFAENTLLVDGSK